MAWVYRDLFLSENKHASEGKSLSLFVASALKLWITSLKSIHYFEIRQDEYNGHFEKVNVCGKLRSLFVE